MSLHIVYKVIFCNCGHSNSSCRPICTPYTATTLHASMVRLEITMYITLLKTGKKVLYRPLLRACKLKFYFYYMLVLKLLKS